MERIQAAKQALEQSQVMGLLSAYSPTVVSTIWAGLDIAGSDIDIVCQFSDEAGYVSDLTEACSGFPGFNLEQQREHVLARFDLAPFQVEIYASTVAVTEQLGYIHFCVMQRLVAIGGTGFQQAIRELKRQGLKTEPAIARYLQLGGEPYAAVAALQSCSDCQLAELMRNAGND